MIIIEKLYNLTQIINEKLGSMLARYRKRLAKHKVHIKVFDRYALFPTKTIDGRAWLEVIKVVKVKNVSHLSIKDSQKDTWKGRWVTVMKRKKSVVDGNTEYEKSWLENSNWDHFPYLGREEKKQKKKEKNP